MDNKNNLQEAYEQSCEMACAALRKLDPQEAARAARVQYDPVADCFELLYMGQQVRLERQNGSITDAQSGQPLPAADRALIAHYLSYAKNAELSGQDITFKQLPDGGAIYAANFQKRAVDPLVKTFGSNLQGLLEAAQKMGGQRVPLGHMGVKLQLLPMVPATYVIWEGDEEIPASGNVIFDSSIVHFLPVEDVVVAASFAVYRMIKLFYQK